MHNSPQKRRLSHCQVLLQGVLEAAEIQLMVLFLTLTVRVEASGFRVEVLGFRGGFSVEGWGYCSRDT